MYRVIFLAFLVVSCGQVAKQPLSIVKAHQESLDNQNKSAALEYWDPSLRDKLKGSSFDVIASMFTGLKLDPSSIKQNCSETQCSVTGIASKKGEEISVNYSFVKIDGKFYISNIQSKNT